MNRKEFLQRIGLGMVAIAVAPKMLLKDSTLQMPVINGQMKRLRCKTFKKYREEDLFTYLLEKDIPMYYDSETHGSRTATIGFYGEYKGT